MKVVQDIISPVEGDSHPRIIHSFDSKPEVINSDPYGEGWVAVIKPESGVEGLLSAEDYFEFDEGQSRSRS